MTVEFPRILQHRLLINVLVGNAPLEIGCQEAKARYQIELEPRLSQLLSLSQLSQRKKRNGEEEGHEEDGEQDE